MSRHIGFGNTRFAFVALLALALLLPVFAAAQVETIDATARGTSTQMGAVRNIKIVISEFSTPEDKAALVDAFNKGQSSGLYDALSKMKPVGQIQMPGTVGYGVAYISSETTPTGRTIRFITNRKIAFGEAARNTQSQAYDLTAGMIEINDKEPKKSAGKLFPATQLIVNKEGQLQWELRKNPWNLTNIIDWNKGKEK
jgi:hypothetical protein